MSQHEEIVLDPGETRRFELSDGETLENLLIDMTAEESRYWIDTKDSTNWTIRNVGVRGTFDPSNLSEGWSGPFFRIEGDGVVENVFLPGGDRSGHSYDGNAGIKVTRYHDDDILIRNVNISNMHDNGIYASSPGHGHTDEAGGGTVRVENSILDGNASSGIRLGTTGSYGRNCVIKRGEDSGVSSRGLWAYYEDITFENCDSFNNNPDVQAGGGAYDKMADATIDAQNCRWETETEYTSSNEIMGSSQGAPQDRVPEGCPTSPLEAATGDASGPTRQTLKVEGVADINEYKFDFDGGVEPGSGTDTHPHDRQDTATSFDGGDRVHGWAGSGSVENWYVEEGAELLGAQIDGEVNVTFGGEPVDLSSVGGLVLGDPCATVSCPTGEVCENGECVPTDPVDPCADVSCGDCKTCENGQCVDIPDCEPKDGNGDGDGIGTALSAVVMGLVVGGAVAYTSLQDDSVK